MTKPVILNLNNQKTNKSQTIVGFGSKILKFCLKIKTFLQMLEKQVSFAKLRTIILNIAKNTQRPCEKTSKGCANFQNCPQRLKNYNCVKHRV